MRMWGIDPRLMCRRHLLGEHVEMHMFAACIRLGKSIAGYVTGGLVETDKIAGRHDELSAEMTRRGMRHASPLDQPDVVKAGRIDMAGNLTEIRRRCPVCRELRRARGEEG